MPKRFAISLASFVLVFAIVSCFQGYANCLWLCTEVEARFRGSMSPGMPPSFRCDYYPNGRGHYFFASSGNTEVPTQIFDCPREVYAGSSCVEACFITNGPIDWQSAVFAPGINPMLGSDMVQDYVCTPQS
jgi:hypothetical protein